jgi:anaerobic ribonucleoside-triphosphate reductase activating protein
VTTLQLRASVAVTDAEGPGRRAAFWLQGCSIRCPGCFNPHMWSATGGRTVDVDDLAHEATRDPAVEGVTFLGGEPFDQAEPLAQLARAVRAAGLSVMTFTGYWLEDLVADEPPGALALLATTDLLVDGPFDARQPDTGRPWVGSRNQRFHHLSGRYAHLGDLRSAGPDRLEVRLSPDGSVFLNGQAPPGVLPAFVRDLGLRPRPRAAQ